MMRRRRPTRPRSSIVASISVSSYSARKIAALSVRRAGVSIGSSLETVNYD